MWLNSCVKRSILTLKGRISEEEEQPLLPKKKEESVIEHDHEEEYDEQTGDDFEPPDTFDTYNGEGVVIQGGNLL